MPSARHGARHRQGAATGIVVFAPAQLGAFRGACWLLTPDCRRCRPDRHGHDVGQRQIQSRPQPFVAQPASAPTPSPSPVAPGQDRANPSCSTWATTTVPAVKIRTRPTKPCHVSLDLGSLPVRARHRVSQAQTDRSRGQKGGSFMTPSVVHALEGQQEPQRAMVLLRHGKHPLRRAPSGREHDQTDPSAHQTPDTMGIATSCWRSIPACSATPSACPAPTLTGLLRHLRAIQPADPIGPSLSPATRAPHRQPTAPANRHRSVAPEPFGQGPL